MTINAENVKKFIKMAEWMIENDDTHVDMSDFYVIVAYKEIIRLQKELKNIKENGSKPWTKWKKTLKY